MKLDSKSTKKIEDELIKFAGDNKGYTALTKNADDAKKDDSIIYFPELDDEIPNMLIVEVSKKSPVPQLLIDEYELIIALIFFL